jgi:hypothetical protein
MFNGTLAFIRISKWAGGGMNFLLPRVCPVQYLGNGQYLETEHIENQ